VTYGFNPLDAPLELGGTHLTPQEFHDSMADENSIVVDVRNFNETAIGRFQPPGALTMTKVCALN
jgi:predicted sulfurtransferase